MFAWFWLDEVSVICRLPRVSVRQCSYTDDGCGDGLNANESCDDDDDYKAAQSMAKAGGGTGNGILVVLFLFVEWSFCAALSAQTA